MSPPSPREGRAMTTHPLFASRGALDPANKVIQRMLPLSHDQIAHEAEIWSWRRGMILRMKRMAQSMCFVPRSLPPFPPCLSMDGIVRIPPRKNSQAELSIADVHAIANEKSFFPSMIPIQRSYKRQAELPKAAPRCNESE
eukprot:scaffold1997_cov318-Pavlova_lutheri.AAC.9